MSVRPNWWLLFAAAPVMLGLLWLDGQLALSPEGHQFLEIGVLLFVCGLLALWVHGNRAALANERVEELKMAEAPDLPETLVFDADRIAVIAWHPSSEPEHDRRIPVPRRRMPFRQKQSRLYHPKFL